MTVPPSGHNGPKHLEPAWCHVTLASIGDAVVTTDTEGRVTFLNPVAESLTGWTQAEAADVPLESVFRIINQETRRTVESPTVRALREGVVVGLANHTLLIARDGTERPIDDSAAPIRNNAGEVAGVVQVFRDITERYRQEQALADAATFSAGIIATLREPFLVLDSGLRVRTANRAFYETFRVEPGETVGHFLYELSNGQWDIPPLRRLLGEVLADHHPVHDFEVKSNFPAIGRKIMLLNASRFVSVDGQPDLILLGIEDLTARNQAEVAVQTSEVRYRRLFQTARDGILILDADSGKILDANPFMAELLGYTHDEFVGKELWEIGLFEDERANRAAYWELHERGYVRYDHLPLLTRDGRQVEVEFVSNRYQVDGRNIAQCNIRDIGERSRLERLANEQAAALADLHRRKDEFLAMLSHELRNPLAPIANAVQLLRLQRAEDPLQKQARTIIERQLTQLTRLIDDLMEVSRISTGRVQLRQERVDANSVVGRSVEAARPLIDRHRHELMVAPSPGPVWLYADASRLEQVFVNLLTNAAKYTPDGGRIGVAVELVGDECVVRVRDTGVGIAPELLPRIFDLFTQAERSLDRSEGGLGIGLALVQRLVELHLGRVEAISVLGQGSEIIVRLPVMLSSETAVSPPPRATPPNGPSLRLLVVDDSVDSAESLATLLRFYGHDVRTAHTGPAALEAALAYHPDAALLDIGLPELDGYQVAERIRRQPVHEKTVLVAMTGYGRDVDRERSRAAGFDHHLVKPVDFDGLLAILATVPAR